MLIKNGKCEDCPCFVAEIRDEICYNGNTKLKTIQTVVCENGAVCARIERYLIEKMSVE